MLISILVGLLSAFAIIAVIISIFLIATYDSWTVSVDDEEF